VGYPPEADGSAAAAVGEDVAAVVAFGFVGGDVVHGVPPGYLLSAKI